MKLGYLKAFDQMGTSEQIQQSVHGTAISINNNGVLIKGPSGSGKSDLAIRLIDRGATLVSDDQVIISRREGSITLNPPTNIAGKIELYSVGIFDVPFTNDIPLAMIVQLHPNSERYPLDRPTVSLLDLDIPTIALDGQKPTAPIKVEMALLRITNRDIRS